MEFKRLINRLNEYLATELGNPNLHIPGRFAWVHSEDKGLKIGKLKDREPVELPSGIAVMKARYEWESILPDAPEFKDVWVMCHTPQRMPHDQWLNLFGDELPQMEYWKPVQTDVGLNALTDARNGIGSYDRSTIIKYVILPKGKRPDWQVTEEFVAMVKQARTLADMEDQMREEYSRQFQAQHKDRLRQQAKEFFPAFGGNEFVQVPHTANIIKGEN